VIVGGAQQVLRLGHDVLAVNLHDDGPQRGGERERADERRTGTSVERSQLTARNGQRHAALERFPDQPLDELVCARVQIGDVPADVGAKLHVISTEIGVPGSPGRGENRRSG
jgi:hypothetical protein